MLVFPWHRFRKARATSVRKLLGAKEEGRKEHSCELFTFLVLQKRRMRCRVQGKPLVHWSCNSEKHQETPVREKKTVSITTSSVLKHWFLAFWVCFRGRGMDSTEVCKEDLRLLYMTCAAAGKLGAMERKRGLRTVGCRGVYSSFRSMLSAALLII